MRMSIPLFPVIFELVFRLTKISYLNHRQSRGSQKTQKILAGCIWNATSLLIAKKILYKSLKEQVRLAYFILWTEPKNIKAHAWDRIGNCQRALHSTSGSGTSRIAHFIRFRSIATEVDGFGC